MHNNELKKWFSYIIPFLDVFLPFLFWLLLIFGFGDMPSGMLTVLAAAIHEAGHIGFRLITEGSLSLPRAVLGGFKIKKPISISYTAELWYAASGPIFNLVAVLFALPFLGKSSGYAELFSIINIMTALSNLLPIEGYDGYRIICCILCITSKGDRMLTFVSRFSAALVAFLTFFSLYLMLRFGSGYWIFGVFTFSLISLVRKKLQKSIF